MLSVSSVFSFHFYDFSLLPIDSFTPLGYLCFSSCGVTLKDDSTLNGDESPPIESHRPSFPFEATKLLNDYPSTFGLFVTWSLLFSLIKTLGEFGVWEVFDFSAVFSMSVSFYFIICFPRTSNSLVYRLCSSSDIFFFSNSSSSRFLY